MDINQYGNFDYFHVGGFERWKFFHLCECVEAVSDQKVKVYGTKNALTHIIPAFVTYSDEELSQDQVIIDGMECHKVHALEEGEIDLESVLLIVSEDNASLTDLFFQGVKDIPWKNKGKSVYVIA